MKTSGTTILDGLHGKLAEERARRGRRAGRQDLDLEDDPPNPRGKSRLDALWNGRDKRQQRRREAGTNNNGHPT